MNREPGDESLRAPLCLHEGEIKGHTMAHHRTSRDPTFDSGYGGLIPPRVEGQVRVMRNKRVVSGCFDARSEVTMGECPIPPRLVRLSQRLGPADLADPIRCGCSAIPRGFSFGASL